MTDPKTSSATTLRLIAVGTPQTFRQQVGRALEVDPDRVEWMPTVTAAESFLADKSANVDLVVLSPGVKDADAIGLAEFVASSAPGTAVVLVRDRTPDGILPLAMRAGIRDVVDLSRGSHELQEALERATAWSVTLRAHRADQPSPDQGQRGKIISIFSSKGGTGKTFLAVNLAVTLAARSKQDIALVDIALDLGDAFSYFGEEPNRPLQDLLAIGDFTDPEQIRSVGMKLSDGVVGYGAPPEPGSEEAVSGDATGKMLRSLRSAFAYTVVDASAGYTDAALSTFDISDVICLVTGLDVVGVRHLSMALDTLHSLGFPRERFRVVLNRADSKVGLEVGDIERVMKLKVDASIPSSRLVPTSLNKGRPVCLTDPKSPVAKSVDGLAARLVGADEAVPSNGAGRRKRARPETCGKGMHVARRTTRENR